MLLGRSFPRVLGLRASSRSSTSSASARCALFRTDRASLPFIVAFYWPEIWSFRVQPTNDNALRQFAPGGELAAIRLAQDAASVWDVAGPARRRELVWAIFDSVKVGDGEIVSVRPKPSLAPLLALRVEKCGPDRGLTRNGEVRIHGVIVEEIEDLLELARGVA